MHVVERDGAASSEASDGAVSLLGCLSGAARRRRERHLRSFGRFAALQWKIAVTTALHHSVFPGHAVVWKVGELETVRALNSAHDDLRAAQGFMVCDFGSKLEEPMRSSLARDFDALTQFLLRIDGQLPCMESKVEQRVAALQASLGSDHDALAESVERIGGSIGRLDDKLAKEILVRRSMRENLLASMVAETSSRTSLEEKGQCAC